MKKHDISKEQIAELFATLNRRVENSNGQPKYKWEDVQRKLEKVDVVFVTMMRH